MAQSLLRLLPAAGKIVGGRVELDGQDLLTMNSKGLAEVRGGRVAMVFQDSVLFGMSLRENIAMGVPDKDLNRVVAVARFVGAHEVEVTSSAGDRRVFGADKILVAVGTRLGALNKHLERQLDGLRDGSLHGIGDGAQRSLDAQLVAAR